MTSPDNLNSPRIVSPNFIFSFTGCKHSKKTLKEMSDKKIGKRNPFFGKKHTAKVRKQMRKSQLTRWAKRRREQ